MFVRDNGCMEDLMAKIRVPRLKTENNGLKLVIFKWGLFTLTLRPFGIPFTVGLDDLWGPL